MELGIKQTFPNLAQEEQNEKVNYIYQNLKLAVLNNLNSYMRPEPTLRQLPSQLLALLVNSESQEVKSPPEIIQSVKSFIRSERTIRVMDGLEPFLQRPNARWVRRLFLQHLMLVAYHENKIQESYSEILRSPTVISLFTLEDLEFVFSVRVEENSELPLPQAIIDSILRWEVDPQLAYLQNILPSQNADIEEKEAHFFKTRGLSLIITEVRTEMYEKAYKINWSETSLPTWRQCANEIAMAFNAIPPGSEVIINALRLPDLNSFLTLLTSPMVSFDSETSGMGLVLDNSNSIQLSRNPTRRYISLGTIKLLVIVNAEGAIIEIDHYGYESSPCGIVSFGDGSLDCLRNTIVSFNPHHPAYTATKQITAYVKQSIESMSPPVTIDQNKIKLLTDETSPSTNSVMSYTKMVGLWLELLLDLQGNLPPGILRAPLNLWLPQEPDFVAKLNLFLQALSTPDHQYKGIIITKKNSLPIRIGQEEMKGDRAATSRSRLELYIKFGNILVPIVIDERKRIVGLCETEPFKKVTLNEPYPGDLPNIIIPSYFLTFLGKKHPIQSLATAIESAAKALAERTLNIKRITPIIDTPRACAVKVGWQLENSLAFLSVSGILYPNYPSPESLSPELFKNLSNFLRDLTISEGSYKAIEITERNSIPTRPENTELLQAFSRRNRDLYQVIQRYFQNEFLPKGQSQQLGVFRGSEYRPLQEVREESRYIRLGNILVPVVVRIGRIIGLYRGAPLKLITKNKPYPDELRLPDSAMYIFSHREARLTYDRNHPIYASTIGVEIAVKKLKKAIAELIAKRKERKDRIDGIIRGNVDDPSALDNDVLTIINTLRSSFTQLLNGYPPTVLISSVAEEEIISALFETNSPITQRAAMIRQIFFQNYLADPQVQRFGKTDLVTNDGLFKENYMIAHGASNSITLREAIIIAIRTGKFGIELPSSLNEEVLTEEFSSIVETKLKSEELESLEIPYIVLNAEEIEADVENKYVHVKKAIHALRQSIQACSERYPNLHNIFKHNLLAFLHDSLGTKSTNTQIAFISHLIHAIPAHFLSINSKKELEKIALRKITEKQDLVIEYDMNEMAQTLSCHHIDGENRFIDQILGKALEELVSFYYNNRYRAIDPSSRQEKAEYKAALEYFQNSFFEEYQDINYTETQGSKRIISSEPIPELHNMNLYQVLHKLCVLKVIKFEEEGTLEKTEELKPSSSLHWRSANPLLSASTKCAQSK